MQERDYTARAKLIEALAEGQNASAAARAAGYSRVHTQRLRRDPEFLALVDRRRAQLQAEPPAAVSPLEARSLLVLGEIRDDASQEGAVRVAACKAILAWTSARKPPAKPAVASAQPKAAEPPKPPASDPGARESVVKLLARAEAERAGRPAC